MVRKSIKSLTGSLALPMLMTLHTSAHASPEALSAFERHVGQCRASYLTALTKVFFQPLNQKWVKASEQLIDFKYDVRKPDSLVSPFVATIDATTLRAVEFTETEEQAQAVQPNTKSRLSRSVIRYTFAYRESNWKFVSANETMTSRDGESGNFRDPISFARTRANLEKDGVPWFLCVLE